MNKNSIRRPVIYALWEPDGGPFYVGRTSTNMEERFWQHAYRTRIQHQAPVYKKIREVGVQNVEIVALQDVNSAEDDPRSLEAFWIRKMIEDGFPLVNVFGKDGVPDSWDDEIRERAGAPRRGRPTWIKGKTGSEAGWTETRRAGHSLTIRRKAAAKEFEDNSLLFARIDRLEILQIRKLQRKLYREVYPERQVTRVPRSGPSHGTRNMYENYKCKCDDCRDAAARHNAKRRGNPNWETVKALPRK